MEVWRPALGLDIVVNRALRLARLWRRMAELRSWRPLADADAVRKTLKSLGCGRSNRPKSRIGWPAITGANRGRI